jgi:hypothetical protein
MSFLVTLTPAAIQPATTRLAAEDSAPMLSDQTLETSLLFSKALSDQLQSKLVRYNQQRLWPLYVLARDL